MALDALTSIEPFRYPAEPIPHEVPAAQSMQTAGIPRTLPVPTGSINNQQIEDYLNRLREGLLADLQALEARIAALEP